MARQRVLGLPIGKQQRRSRMQMAKMAGAAAAMVAAPAVGVPAARKVAPAARKASQMVGKGKEVAGQVSGAMDTATDVKQAVSSHSSTIGKIGGAISAAKGGGSGGGTKPKLSHLIEQHTDIAAPRSVVYNQWTQLEMFATITKGVDSVEQQSDEKSKWTSKIGPSRRTWTGHVVEQVPDERIAWKAEGGAQLQGVVTFHVLDVDLTRVLLQMEYKPTGAVEWVGNTLRIQRRRAKRDLRLFKHFVELRGEETGKWRGRIDEGQKLEPLLAGQGRVRAKQSSDRGSGGDAGANNRGSSSSSRSNGRPARGGTSASSSSNGRGSGSRSSSNGRRASSRSSANGRSTSGRTRAASGSRSSAASRTSAGQSRSQATPRKRRSSTPSGS
ncbi:MAG: SRPBCC family protein [Acidimicrobiales bacterium]